MANKASNEEIKTYVFRYLRQELFKDNIEHYDPVFVFNDYSIYTKVKIEGKWYEVKVKP